MNKLFARLCHQHHIMFKCDCVISVRNIHQDQDQDQDDYQYQYQYQMLDDLLDQPTHLVLKYRPWQRWTSLGMAFPYWEGWCSSSGVSVVIIHEIDVTGALFVKYSEILGSQVFL